MMLAEVLIAEENPVAETAVEAGVSKVLVTGGAGYVGSRLVPLLLADGCEVTVLDTFWFGNGFLPTDNENLRLVKADIRDIDKVREAMQGQDAVIHMACISNDVSCQLDEALSTSINYDAFEPLVIAAKEAGVKRFIYCSSSSVYGISNAANVTEEHALVPLTLYNRYKAECEPLLFKHQTPDFTCVVIRPATVCGYAPRMRFDLTVNILTNHAVQKNAITVYGGNQRRPNLHMDDMCDTYRLLLAAPAEKIAGQIFNVGQQNLKVSEIAELVRRMVYQRFGRFVPIRTEASQDNRSYHIDSSKIFHVLGFKPKRTVEDAIRDICIRFEQGCWPDSLTNPHYINVLQYTKEYGFGKQAAA